MSILSAIFGKREDSGKLAEQMKEFEALHEILEKSSQEIDSMKELLVKRANGALYPHGPGGPPPTLVGASPPPIKG